jgi:hypothetical protein
MCFRLWREFVGQDEKGLKNFDHVFFDGEHIAAPRNVFDEKLTHNLVAEYVAQSLNAGSACGFVAIGCAAA